MTMEIWGGNNTPAVAPKANELATDSWTKVLKDVVYLAENISQTEFVPKGLQSTPKCAAAILYGRELGMPPMTALSSVHVINGRPGISAESMRALILGAGHEIQVVSSDSDRCVIKGRRAGEDEWQQTSYTMTEAQRAGDTAKNPNYKTRPAEMLVARATTRLARIVFPDVIRGIGSLEELQDLAAEATVTVQTQQPKQPSAQRPSLSRKRKPKESKESAEPEPTPPPVRKTAPLSRVPAKPEPESVVEVEEIPRHPASGVVIHFKRLGIEDREKRLATIGVLVGHPVTSAKDLTAEEISQLLDALGKLRDSAALDAYVTARMPGTGEQRDELGRIRNHLRNLGVESPEAMTDWAADFVDRPGLKGLVELTAKQRKFILADIEGGAA